MGPPLHPAQEGWSLGPEGTGGCGLYSPFASGISTDNLDVGILGEYLNVNPPWEDMVVNKIKNMLVTEQGLVLDTICLFLEKHSQVGSERLILPTGWEIHGAWEEANEPCVTCPKPPC